MYRLQVESDDREILYKVEKDRLIVHGMWNGIEYYIVTKDNHPQLYVKMEQTPLLCNFIIRKPYTLGNVKSTIVSKGIHNTIIQNGSSYAYWDFRIIEGVKIRYSIRSLETGAELFISWLSQLKQIGLQIRENRED